MKPRNHCGKSDGDDRDGGSDHDGGGDSEGSDYGQDRSQTKSSVMCDLFVLACLLWLYNLAQISAHGRSKVNYGWLNLHFVLL